MIEIVEYTKISLRRFGMWIVSSLSSPVTGVIYVETKKESESDTV